MATMYLVGMAVNALVGCWIKSPDVDHSNESVKKNSLTDSTSWLNYRWQRRRANCTASCWLPGRIWCGSLQCRRGPSRAPRGWPADAPRSSESASSRYRPDRWCDSPPGLWGWVVSRHGRRSSWIWARTSLVSGRECGTGPASSRRSAHWKVHFDLCCSLLSPVGQYNHHINFTCNWFKQLLLKIFFFFFFFWSVLVTWNVYDWSCCSPRMRQGFWYWQSSSCMMLSAER